MPAAVPQGNCGFEAAQQTRNTKPCPEGAHEEGAGSTENRRGEAGCLYQKGYLDYVQEWLLENSYRVEAYMRYGNAKIARLERLLCDAGGEW